MSQESENVVLEQLLSFRDEFKSCSAKVDGEFKKVNTEAQCFRTEVNKRFDLVDNQLSRHDKRLFRLEHVTHHNGLTLEDTSKRMELAGEGVASILETVHRLVASDEARYHQDARLSGVEVWAKEHQRDRDKGKL